MPTPAAAEEAPEQGTVQVQFARYTDSQPGLDRLTVNSPSLYVLAPIGRRWAVEGSLTHDDVSGASPRYYTDVTGASRMEDSRNAGDLRVTRYFDRQTLSVGASHSSEHDYVSNAVSVSGTMASEDHNTTWNAGIGLSNDRIDPVNDLVSNEHRRTLELQAGVTQALTPLDLVQANLTLGRGRGYYSDPYKLYDHRPRSRDTQVLLLRWNHWLDNAIGGALKLSYRYYHDSFGISAHTTEMAWAKPVGDALTITPSLRYYTQRAADFYVDPVSDTTVYPAPYGSPTYSSTDQRMAGFGAIGLGLRADWRIDRDWFVGAKVERYEQRSGWRLGGDGSPGIDPLRAWQWQISIGRHF